jgi:hypothetical protein
MKQRLLIRIHFLSLMRTCQNNNNNNNNNLNENYPHHKTIDKREKRQLLYYFSVCRAGFQKSASAAHPLLFFWFVRVTSIYIEREREREDNKKNLLRFPPIQVFL